jgi:hypothetical protein
MSKISNPLITMVSSSSCGGVQREPIGSTGVVVAQAIAPTGPVTNFAILRHDDRDFVERRHAERVEAERWKLEHKSLAESLSIAWVCVRRAPATAAQA